MRSQTYLRVKIRSLAAEARIIRHETRRAETAELKNGLALHRTGVVRREARHALLAYAFLRGVPLAAVERAPKRKPDWTSVAKMVSRFGEDSAGLEDWRLARESNPD